MIVSHPMELSTLYHALNDSPSQDWMTAYLKERVRGALEEAETKDRENQLGGGIAAND